MIKGFIKYILEQKLFAADDKILLGVSGGIDSMVMLNLFDKAGYNFDIAHCNFQLRGDESNEDQRFIENYAHQNKLNLFVKQFDTKNYAEQNKISIQMAARELRLNWFKELLTEKNLDFYATAHHLDDQAETFFINLMRGTGIAGLHGILPKRNKLIHPLLFTNRIDIINYANKENIPFREDSSNKTTKYLRNKIRQQLIPILNEINPGFNEILSENISRLRESEIIYRKEIERTIDKLLANDSNNSYTIAIPGLQKLSEPILYLFEIITRFGFNYADAKDLILSLNSISGKQFYSATHRIVRDRDFFIVQKMEESCNSKTEFSVHDNQSTIDEPIKLQFRKIEFTQNTKIPTDRNIAFFDFDKIKFPLKIRKWEEGDYFYPLGMKNKKLLSDYFIDNKFSIPEKENIWLLTSREDIVWIIGSRIDDRFKVTNNTFQALIVSLAT